MFDIVSSDAHILWLYNIMDRIYRYNQDVSYNPKMLCYVFGVKLSMGSFVILLAEEAIRSSKYITRTKS